MKKPPKIIKVFPSLERNPNYPMQEFKIRVVEYPTNPDRLLDIREYITSDLYTGYSPKGISITFTQFKYLLSLTSQILLALEKSNETQGEAKVS